MDSASTPDPTAGSGVDRTRVTPSAPPRVSIVLPCRDGGAYVEESLQRLHDHLERCREAIGSYELIFVDDGSRDGCAEQVARCFPEVKVIRHAVNRGKGAAVRTGVLAATGRFTVFIDADVPYGLDALDRMLDYLDRKEFHLCIGTRPRDSPTLSRRSVARRAASVLFTAFVSRIVVTGIRDTQCGFKGFRSDVAKFLFGQGRVENFAFDVEVLYLAYKNDLDIKRLPVTLERDDDSSVSLLRHAPPMLMSTLALPFRYHSGGYAPLPAPEER